jgi:hypothetical protein
MAKALKFCQQKMPKDKRIGYYHADSTSYQAGVINWCFENKVLFIITADKDKAVMAAIKGIKQEEWRPYKGTGR